MKQIWIICSYILKVMNFLIFKDFFQIFFGIFMNFNEILGIFLNFYEFKIDFISA